MGKVASEAKILFKNLLLSVFNVSPACVQASVKHIVIKMPHNYCPKTIGMPRIHNNDDKY